LPAVHSLPAINTLQLIRREDATREVHTREGMPTILVQYPIVFKAWELSESYTIQMKGDARFFAYHTPWRASFPQYKAI